MNRETLVYIAEILNKTNSTWGVGGSLLLFQYGLINKVNDLDIIVQKTHVEPVVSELRKLGQEREVHPLAPFLTTHYYEFTVKDISMDVMSEFKIKHEEGIYVLPFSEHSIEYHLVKGIKVPFCILEDWYILYQLIPGREEKVKLIEKYFIENGIRNTPFLGRALRDTLPKHVKIRIQNLLEQCVPLI